jgi:hypothetical protein
VQTREDVDQFAAIKFHSTDPSIRIVEFELEQQAAEFPEDYVFC